MFQPLVCLRFLQLIVVLVLIRIIPDLVNFAIDSFHMLVLSFSSLKSLSSFFDLLV